MVTTLLAEIDKLIRERGSASVLRDHLALLREQVVLLTRHKEESEAKATNLEQRLAEAERELARHRAAQEFVEGPGGALFKRGRQGGYVAGVFCPVCHRPTSTFPTDSEPFCCDGCRWFSTFSGNDLPAILAGLQQDD